MKFSKFVNGCVGKRRFGKLRDATRYSKWVFKKFNDVQEPYFCDSCGFWHIGHSNKKGKQQ